MPLGAAIVFLGVALSEGTKSIKGTPAAIALAILLISSIPLMSQWLVSNAEQSVINAYQRRAEICGDVCPAGTIPAQGEPGDAGAIVVMGESDDIDRALSIFEANNDVSLNTSLAPRLIYAANLYRQARSQGASPVVFATAGAGDSGSQQRQIIRNILTSNGVFGEDIVIEDTGLDVYRTAQEVETLLQNRRLIAGSRAARREQGTENDPRVFLVAPAIIMSRAALTFEKMALEVVAKPTDFFSLPTLASMGDRSAASPTCCPAQRPFSLQPATGTSC